MLKRYATVYIACLLEQKTASSFKFFEILIFLSEEATNAEKKF